MALIIVSGPPCSGKSTYVRDHLGDRDICFDYDKIANALTGKSMHTLADKNHARPYVLAARMAMLEAYKHRALGINDFYVITSSQSPVFWAAMEDYGPERVEMGADLETCLGWLAQDESRPEKEQWETIIKNWFDRKEKAMAKEAQKSGDGKTITFYVLDEIRPDRKVYDWNTGNYRLEESTTGQRYFAEALKNVGPDQKVELYINSMGGDVKEALGIVNTLKRCPAKVIAYVDGFAASAASVLTQGADEIYMPRNTCMMLHNARWVTEGNPKELRKSADDLEVINQTIINSYAARAGEKLSAQVLQQILDEETWLTAEQCIQYGLADGYTDYDADIQKAAEQFKAAASSGAAAYAKAPASIAALLRLEQIPAPEQIPSNPQAGAPEQVKGSLADRLLNAIKKMEV